MHYSLCDSILDLFQNSVEADSRTIVLDFIQDESSLKLTLKDDGVGMDEATLKRVQDPFFTDGIKHKHRKVGLGIPFLIQTVEATEGSFNLESEKGVGTKLNILFNLSHWDTPPIGDIVELLVSLMAFDGNYEFIFNRENKINNTTYTIARSELTDVLGNLNKATNMILLKEFIASQELDN